MKEVLITGGTGFIGSYFINKYKGIYNISKFSFREQDIESLNYKNIDVVFHLSALVHQMKGASSNEYNRINVSQTIELATKSKDLGVKKFIFMSTVKVYGEENLEPYTENTKCNPIDEYGKSKLKAEKELLKLADDNFKVSIIRTPIVYGYGVKANIKSLMKLVSNMPILPFGAINNKRSMIYIGNLCNLVNEVIKSDKNGIFLAADDKSLSTSELILAIANALEKKVFLLKIPFFESLLKVLKASFHKRLYESLEVNNQKTKKILSLSNPYSIDEGIKLMIKGEQF